jgi:polyhydroxybutyrate depolymerase
VAAPLQAESAMNASPSIPRLALLGGLLAASLAAGGCTAHAVRAPAGRAPVTMKWTVDGVERQALVFAPAGAAGRSGAGSSPAPLVFAFHGHGGSMEEAAGAMDLQSLWPQAIVVYPQGLHAPAGRVDPLGLRSGWQLRVADQDGRDVKLVDAMLASLRARYRVDDRRIYSTGFSNGGFFSYILWATRPRTFAAFASCAGRIGDDVQLAVPKPILQVTGEKDHIVPTEYQLATIATVRALDGATGEGEACGAGCNRYAPAQAAPHGAPVEVVLHAGGHLYPPGASAEIVKFFQANMLAE